MKPAAYLGVVVLVAYVTTVGAQTGTPVRPPQTGTPQEQASSEGVLPPKAYFTQRDSSLERELLLLKESESRMGESHPQLPAIRKKIRDLEAEVEAFHSIPNPFRRLENEGLGPRDIVQQLNDEELRTLVVRLSIDVKDLRSRVVSLEKQIEMMKQRRR
ncbi:MAG: hypothetical protein AB8B50_19835 [Pirellulaceae bacterium]